MKAQTAEVENKKLEEEMVFEKISRKECRFEKTS